ncbi:MAG: phosphohydrolase [Solibacterales bacterium]|nr:phosphohydrolase [Bryobacterales bacterium]|tara:strand:+ start:2326 stop:3654 length:1329 start_codon:yes stop_codon:yes gene_type:complete
MTHRALALSVIRVLKSHRHKAYLVGGCVRDLLLGHEPKDYDIATEARSDQIQNYFPGSQMIGEEFGVTLVHEGEARVEVATFRRDREYHDGRRPSGVDFTNIPQQDATRRDFTINAIFFDPIEHRYFDYVGGRADLQSGVIRSIGDPQKRFIDDKLRMLRAVRLAARLDFYIETETRRAIERCATRITEISAQRVRDELSAMLTERKPRAAFELLDEVRLLSAILPEVSKMRGVSQPAEYHPKRDVWQHTLLLLENLRTPTVTLAWGALLHDVGKPDTISFGNRIRFNNHVEVGVKIAESVLMRLHFSNKQTRRILLLVANHMRFSDVTAMRKSRLLKFLQMEHFDEHLELHRLDCMASHGKLQNYNFIRGKLSEIPGPKLRPIRLVNGDDLIAAGYCPGPSFREMLAWVEMEQSECEVLTKDGLLAKLRENFPLIEYGKGS